MAIRNQVRRKQLGRSIAIAGKRLDGIQEVSGSIPLISIKKKDSCSQRVHESLLFSKHNVRSGYLIQTYRWPRASGR